MVVSEQFKFTVISPHHCVLLGVLTLLSVGPHITFLSSSPNKLCQLVSNHLKSKPLGYTLGLAFISQFHLAHSAENIEVFQVTGSHLATNELAEPIPAISLNADDINALSASNFADVLRGLPGVDISQQGGQGGLTFLSIRGGDPNFVTILIDGVKVNDPTNSRGGAFDLGTIDPSIIEKVDLYYGSYSTVYGSDALAGVISITTKQMDDNHIASVSLRYGENNKLGANVHVGAPIASIARANLSASWQDGDNSTFSEAFSRKQVVASLTSLKDVKTQWQLGGFHTQGEGAYFPEDSGGDRLAVIRTPERRDYSQTNLNGQLNHPFNDKLNLTITSAYSNREEDITNPGISEGELDGVPPIDSSTKYSRLDSLLKLNYTWSKFINSSLGVATSHEDGEMQSVIDFGVLIDANYKLDRKTHSGFAEISAANHDWYNLIVGIRFDDNEQISVSTHRVIASFYLPERLTIQGQFSEGFKLPSFYALGHPLVGNSELKPEQSENFELSAHKLDFDNRLSTRLSVYQNTYTDLVDFDPVAFTNVNRSTIRVKGAELSTDFEASSQWKVSAQVSINDINTYDENVILRRRPELKGSIKMQYQVSEPLSITARYSINDDFYDSSVATGFLKVKGRNQFDLSALWESDSDISWRLYINNLFDNDQEEVIGFTQVGRDINASVTFKI